MYSFSISPDASPELYRALAGLPARLRGERLRQLATLGLVLAQQGVAVQSQLADPADPADPEQPDSALARRQAARARFVASVT